VFVLALTGKLIRNRNSAKITLKVQNSEVLYDEIRRLFIERAIWSRQKLIGKIDKIDDTQSADKKLEMVADSVGNAFNQYYGDKVGRDLSSMMKKHDVMNINMVSAISQGDQHEADSKEEERRRDAHNVAQYLCNLNPYWKVDEFESHIHDACIKPIKQQAQARANRNFDEDERIIGKAYAQSVRLADYICEGLVRQFPDKAQVS
jgi:hypothetical protein